MPTKIKMQQIETPKKVQGRDSFQTPNYAIDLIVPFIPKYVKEIWECADGKDGKITNRLFYHGYDVYYSGYEEFGEELSEQANFLTAKFPVVLDEKVSAIITNPPFSLKKKFYERCLFHKIPFALLIPADYSGWVIDAIRFDGCEKVIPTRRIDYITPTGLSGATGNSSNFHSLWLTWGFKLGKSEIFVELKNKDKENI